MAYCWCYWDQGVLAVKTPTGESNKMNVTEFKLNQIVESNYCRYDIHSGCVHGEVDAAACASCVAESVAEIVRTQV